MSSYILIGSPGSGKGTLGQYLKSTFDIEHLSSGDLLRKEVNQESDIGKQIKSILTEGGQVHDTLITNLVLEKLNSLIKNKKKFVLDGYPQTSPQLKCFEEFLEKNSDHPVTFICIDVEEETALSRMVKRVSCMNCDEIYNKDTCPPTTEGECDKCGSQLITRNSDQTENAKLRLKQFEQTTKKVMEIVRKKSGTLNLDGNLSRGDIQNILKKSIE